MAPRIAERARRYAAVQERLIAADGSFPAVGRSIAYRCGAFHLLADIALRRSLPDEVSPAQVRGALTRGHPPDARGARRRSTPTAGCASACADHQPGIGETYISTGSLYLCAVALLPLGLPASDPFWSAPSQPWTAAKAWSGQAFPIDHALATYTSASEIRRSRKPNSSVVPIGVFDVRRRERCWTLRLATFKNLHASVDFSTNRFQPQGEISCSRDASASPCSVSGSRAR